MVPPSRPVPISVSRLARRFGVSRPHVLKLLNDAASEGFIERIGPAGDRAVVLPRLADAAQNFFATMFLFFADCAREALDCATKPVHR
jgi:DNA-binding GntR family transcriptional regulator